MLERMLVVDLTQQLPGPYATALLGRLGARVIKVEPPTGDPARRLDPAMFARVNAGKQSVVLDLKSRQGRDGLHRIVAAAGVCVEGFRPGVAARLGADWNTLSGLNPSLVHCSISGFGQHGPYASTPAHDLNFQALAGTVTGADRAHAVGVPWVDLGAGTGAALAVVAAWHAARATGQGRFLDLTMLDVALAWGRIKPHPPGQREPTYGVFRTADERDVVIAILEDHFWGRLCAALGWTDWAHDQTLASYPDRVSRAATIGDRLADAIRSRALPEVLTLARRYDLPITVRDPADDEAARQQLVLRGDGPFGPPLPVPEVVPPVDPPALGQHTHAVLAEFDGGRERTPDRAGTPSTPRRRSRR